MWFVAVTVVVGLLAAWPGTGLAHATSTGPPRADNSSCPAAETLVAHTKWHRRLLAPGVRMSSGTATDARGTVNMHILRVNLASKNVALHPLMHSLAERSPLSVLAQGHPRLVAVTNTGFFDFRTGAPTSPLISGGKALVISSAHQTVVGLGANNRLQAAHVWWSATLTAGKRTHSVVAENETDPPQGIAFYNAKWGSAPVPAGWSGLARAVVGGVVSPLSGQSRHGVGVPSGGYLLVANGASARSWLSSLATGTKVSIAATIKTGAPHPFVQAYGVGVNLVPRPGVALTRFGCDSANTKQPARTAIGFLNGGRTMIIAIVADNPFTSMHGLDNNQMASLMNQLGVSDAYDFDGSGSTELLAKLHASSGLTLQNYPADGQERMMPLGLGITSTPVKAVKKKKTKR